MLAASLGATAAERLPPTWVIYTETFGNSTQVSNFWQPQSGSWSLSRGTYDSDSSPASIATMYQYPSDTGNPPPRTDVYSNYDFEVRLLTPRTSEGWVGVVFAFQNISTYMETVFGSNGTMEVRTVIGGLPTINARGHSLGFGPGEWIDVKVTHHALLYTIWINGFPILRGPNLLFHSGDVGVIAHDAPAHVDDVVLSIPAGDQPFSDDFSDGIFDHWEPTFQTLGQWSVANGTFNNTTVQQLSFARMEINPQNGTRGFTLRASMLNPYGASGNQVGIAFNYSPRLGSYHEVVFLPTGLAKVNFVSANGVVHTLASAPYPGRRNVWFDVMVQVKSHLDVAVNGRPLFAEVPATESGFLEGAAGLITHWAPGRFDNVRFDPFITEPLSENFSAGLPPGTTAVGAWNTNGGTLNGTSAGNTDLVTFGCACWKTDFVYTARLLNQYGASGNLVGLIYSYQEATEPHAGDYYEVVFAPTGEAYMNRIVNGARYRMASAAHNVGPNTWFDVELVRSGGGGGSGDSTYTTVKVNGSTLFTRVPQGQFGFGRVGVITHWARGRFDNLSIEPRLTP